MLRVPQLTMVFKSVETKYFFKMNKGGIKLLEEYLEDPTIFPKEISNIQVCSLKIPNREMAWLFSRITRKESTSNVPKVSLYILEFSIHENSIFDWSRIISSELSFQLGNFHKSKKTYMLLYFIFTMTYCHVFKGLPLAKRLTVNLTLYKCCTLHSERTRMHIMLKKQDHGAIK
jgi:hypothetical protein